MALLPKQGYGQVEPNHLSAQRNGQIYAQLPCKSTITILENGQFAKYDYAAGEVNYSGEGEWMLVFSEVKLYDPKHSYKDFKMDVKDNYDGKIYPRLLKTMPGDIFTTNLIDLGADAEPTVGKVLQPGASTGVLTITAAPVEGVVTFKIVKVYTLADGQAAVKVQRIA